MNIINANTGIDLVSLSNRTEGTEYRHGAIHGDGAGSFDLPNGKSNMFLLVNCHAFAQGVYLLNGYNNAVYTIYGPSGRVSMSNYKTVNITAGNGRWHYWCLGGST